MEKWKIDVSYPFLELYDKAYMVASQGRRTVILYSTKTRKRKTTSYARYIMSVSVGRMLTSTEHVDHIDGDKSNDVIENLQILTPEENHRKTHRKPDIVMTCPRCETEFKKTRTQLRGRVEKAKKNLVFCSRKCAGYSGKTGSKS